MKRCTRCGVEKPKSDFYSYMKGERGPYFDSYCKRCKAKTANVSQQRRYKERMKKAEDLLGGRCVDCGANEVPLYFDHKERGPQISGIIMRSWDRVIEELKRCELRCWDCHHERHGRLWMDNRPI